MKKLIKLLLGLSLLATLTFAAGYIYLRTSLPTIDGTQLVQEAENDITIARDGYGIPHITAQSTTDLYFGLGFAHAQDRLWQMDMNRRIGHGRLSEIAGESTLSTDKYMRTLGFSERAQSAFDASPKAVQDKLTAYADGVNAYLKTRQGALPIEFILTRTEPAPWKPVDTLVWQKLMWLDLSGNMRHEIERARLLTKLNADQLASIYPPYPGDTEAPFPALQDLYAAIDMDALADTVGAEPEESIGSNNWVVSGARTESGKPLLANDPHLGLTTPSIWYLARLHNASTGKNTVGVTFPGSPAIIIGRNDKIAWGFTNTAPDIQDTFIEKLIGDDQYLTPDGPATFSYRKETVSVKDAAPHTFTVRETRHGPVISDVIGTTEDFLKSGYVLALQWTALAPTDSSIQTFTELPAAESFEDFVKAGQTYMGPEQNMIYADTDGNIGYHAPAMIPVRHAENTIINGRLPSPGWLRKYDWQGFIPMNEVPKRFNPETGIIATANEKIVGPDYPHYITRDWAHPFRGDRIRNQLESKEKHSLESFAALQYDMVSDNARDLLPSIRAVLGANTFPNWNGDMDRDRPEPLLFHLFLRKYQQEILEDDLGTMYEGFTRFRPALVKSTLYWSSQTPPENSEYFSLPVLPKSDALAWCDNQLTNDITETCPALAQKAYKEAKAELNEKYPNGYRWGDEHIVRQTHRPFSEIKALRSVFELSAPLGGSRYTINVAGVSSSDKTLHQSTHGASYRGLFDLSDLNKSLFIQPTGQSGNPLSKHYNDLFPLWLNGDYITIPTDTVVPQNAAGILTLKVKND
ncbi:penicillin amidase [Kordiimonas sediminis]|uniref:Penicillin amidase n=1 Tax=Kordiimonas sediminis TaxID=1735581 RepID=A0A919E938_9PROT|nr:penicillin acylase family protein [Kordiimonas sediminis]GHF26347.1 penicillin amidase [Kordiimonas sediminis]